MNIFSYLKTLNLNKAKLDALRNRDYIQLEKKLIQKSYFNSSLDKKEIPEFIKILKYNNKEISVFFKPSFYGLRKIIEHPERIHNFENKESIESLVSDKLIQFVELNFSSRIEQYKKLCLKENNLGSLKSLLGYKQVLSDSTISNITTYLNTHLISLESYLNGNLNTSFETQEILKNRHFFGCLSKVNSPEIENSIIRFQELIRNQLVDNNYSSTTLSLINSLKDFDTKNNEIQENAISLNQKKKEITEQEAVIKKNETNKQAKLKRKKSNNYATKSSSWIDWKIIVTILMAIFSIARFCTRNNSSSSNNYEHIEETYHAPDYELKLIQEEFLYLHSTKEIFRTQDEEFTRSRMKFISKIKKFAFPGAPYTYIKNKTNKNVVFFFNNPYGGFNYKLINPNSEISLNLHYKYFLILRGNKPMYTYYKDALGEDKIGILFNDFTESDRKILNNIYRNDIQPSKKQSQIIIYEDSVIINEKS
jgi:hypothetical protein